MQWKRALKLEKHYGDVHLQLWSKEMLCAKCKLRK